MLLDVLLVVRIKMPGQNSKIRYVWSAAEDLVDVAARRILTLSTVTRLYPKATYVSVLECATAYDRRPIISVGELAETQLPDPLCII